MEMPFNLIVPVLIILAVIVVLAAFAFVLKLIHRGFDGIGDAIKSIISFLKES